MTSVGMGIAFVLSRSVGLPGFHEQWTSDANLGLVSLALDALFTSYALARMISRRPSSSTGRHRPALAATTQPAASALVSPAARP
jgi:hypothetical protein